MKKSFSQFFQESLHHYFEAVLNVFIFLPYFFSVSTLLRTLFAPWKNIVTREKKPGWSFSELMNQLSFNLISRFMGFVMRSSVLLFYAILLVLLVLLVPFITILYIAFTPVLFMLNNGNKTPQQYKEALLKQFLSTHMLDPQNFSPVTQWFEEDYQQRLVKTDWWKLQNLYTTPPIGRDWTVGYTPTLDNFTDDLATVEYQAQIKHMVDREREIDQIERILSRSTEANVIIVGEEGVGKHTIIDAFAKKLYEGQTNPLLIYKRILKLNMEKVLTQYVDMKAREVFIEELFSEAILAQNIILFIENFDKYISAEQGRVDLSIPLEKYARSANLQIIGFTTPFAYQKYIFPNDKINRTFSKVDVYEVSKDEAKKIMLDQNHIFEQRYHVFIPYETITAVVEKSDFYITHIPFPEKAMQLLDNACVYTVEKLNQNVVVPQTLDIILTEKTHVPVTLSADMKQKLVNLEQLLMQRVVNQNKALRELSSALRRSFLLLGKRKKPLASFLFLGPTGVGKTETAKAITDVFFGDSSSNLIRFDMSNYQSKTDIPKLIGSQESNNLGLLTEKIRENPYGVLLLDEIEKADKDLLNIFLTMLDEGYMVDGFGRRVDCKNLVIIATSNAGADYIYNNINENSNSDTAHEYTNGLIDHLVKNHIFSPEFLNRFDGVIAYQSLNENSTLAIAQRMLDTVNDQIFAAYKVRVTVSPQSLQSIVQKNFNPAFGARNLERILRTEIEDQVAKLILSNQAHEGDTIHI